MYKNSFYIHEEVGNNAFSYNKRSVKHLFVPNLVSLNSYKDIALGNEIAFSDVDFQGELKDYTGLKNFYEFEWLGKRVFLFDNHNHAYYFWHLARLQGSIKTPISLFHIDEHADTRDPGEYLGKGDLQDLQKIFHYTNYTLNVGNYIIPAQKDGLIGNVFQIRSETNILEYLYTFSKYTPYILNLDLDFFEPNLDYIDYELKKKCVLKIAREASLITIATSPYFIHQELALKVFKDIFTIGCEKENIFD